jgi:hypothetical protein
MLMAKHHYWTVLKSVSCNSCRKRHYFCVAPRFLSPVKKMLRVFAMLYDCFARDSFFFKRLQKVVPSLSRGVISGSADSISRSRFNFDFSTQKRDFKNLRLISRSAATATRE